MRGNSHFLFLSARYFAFSSISETTKEQESEKNDDDEYTGVSGAEKITLGAKGRARSPG